MTDSRSSGIKRNAVYVLFQTVLSDDGLLNELVNLMCPIIVLGAGSFEIRGSVFFIPTDLKKYKNVFFYVVLFKYFMQKILKQKKFLRKKIVYLNKILNTY